VSDWARETKLSPRGAFLKKARVTSTVEVAEQDKKRAFPGPNHYQTITISSKKSESVNHSPRAEKNCTFIEEARFRSSITPFGSYRPNFVSLTVNATEQHRCEPEVSPHPQV